MKYDEIEISRQLETVVPVENETQRVLREALMRLENGAMWHQGGCRSGDKVCAVTALGIAIGARDRPYITGNSSSAHGFLTDAARQLNGYGPGLARPAQLNDTAKDFSEVRAMFLKAIELAA